MSADWFCKIGDKKVGPLNGQQLKTFVAKGQLKPEHLVRRGSEGPWVPAGRIKGLFLGRAGGAGQSGSASPATGKPLPKAAKSNPPPSAKAGSMPTAAEAPTPPASDIPQELMLGGHHKHHVEMNFDKFDIETTPVMVSRRKMKSGLQGLKKSDQKKANVILLSVIGGGTAFGLIVFIWAFATGKFSSSKPETTQAAAPQTPGPADTAKKPEAEKKPEEKKSDQPKWPTRFKSVSVESTPVGKVEVKVLKPLRAPKPEGIKSDGDEVLIVPVYLQLKPGETKSVEFTSWADEHLKKLVLLKDDKAEGKGNSYEFLGLVVKSGEVPKAITEKRVQIRLVFELPGKMPKDMYLALPGAAVHAEGTTIGYQFGKSDIGSEAAKPAASGSSDKTEDRSDSKEVKPKGDK